jgi:hypothetical protein
VGGPYSQEHGRFPMSAFIVSKQHIDAIVTTALAWRVPTPGNHGTRMHRFSSAAQELGQMLWTENFRSVNFLYRDERPEKQLYQPNFYSAKVLDPVQALKAIACLEYQSCEHPDWEASEAHRFAEAFRCEAISRLPGYEEAAWEIR